jgi:hypothetical protein
MLRLRNGAETQEQSKDCPGPDLASQVRAFLSSDPVPRFRQLPSADGTATRKTAIRVCCELLAFHQSSPIRNDPLADFHAEQCRAIKARIAMWLVRAAACALVVDKALNAPWQGSQSPKITKIAARYDLPSRSKLPRPI